MDYSNEIIVDTISLALYDDLYYNTSLYVGGVKLKFYFGFNSRLKKRWLYVEDQSDRVVLSQTFLSSNKRCDLNFYANQSDVSGYVTINPLDINKDYSDWDYTKWKDDFLLRVVYNTQELEDLLSENYISVVVS